jgi:ParB family chromosome partitioning protein
MATKGLGKGFDVLVPVGLDVSVVTAGAGDKVHHLALDVVVPKDDQPRRNFDTQALNQLAHSIRQHGVIQPIIVVENEQNLYAIVAGERRWRAAKIAGLKEIPAIVRTVDELERLELALLENVQRADLSPLEQAIAIQKLHKQFDQSYDQIAQRLGKAYTTVVNSIRLLQLPLAMQDSLSAGSISEGHARTLLSLQKLPNAQIELFTNILNKGWSVRQSEQFAIAAKASTANDVVKKEVTNNNDQLNYNETTKSIENKLGTKVAIRHSVKGSGSLVIKYKSTAELERIARAIGNN